MSFQSDKIEKEKGKIERKEIKERERDHFGKLHFDTICGFFD